MSRKDLNFKDDKIILDIFNCAKEVYGSGIAVPVYGGHPCGREWLGFENIDDEDNILTYEFQDADISNGCSNGDYTDRTLKEILEITEGRFAFEVNTNNINWDED